MTLFQKSPTWSRIELRKPRIISAVLLLVGLGAVAYWVDVVLSADNISFELAVLEIAPFALAYAYALTRFLALWRYGSDGEFRPKPVNLERFVFRCHLAALGAGGGYGIAKAAPAASPEDSAMIVLACMAGAVLADVLVQWLIELLRPSR
jgi:hypothetical protein